MILRNSAYLDTICNKLIFLIPCSLLFFSFKFNVLIALYHWVILLSISDGCDIHLVYNSDFKEYLLCFCEISSTDMVSSWLRE